MGGFVIGKKILVSSALKALYEGNMFVGPDSYDWKYMIKKNSTGNN